MADLPATKPVYRSRLCWLGVPGLVFLLWIWWDSSTHTTEVEWDRGRHFYQAGAGEGAFYLTRYTELELRKRIIIQRPIMGVRDRIIYQLPSSAGGAMVYRESGWDFPPGLERADPSHGFSGREASGGRIGCWLIILSYVVGWLGTLAWWQRRTARLLKASASPPP